MSLRSRRAVGTGLTWLTGLAAALVIGMLGFILWDVVAGGWTRISLRSSPRRPARA